MKVWECDSDDDDDDDAILRYYSENPSDLRAALVQLLQREVDHDLTLSLSNSCRSSQRLLLTIFNTCQLKISYHQLKESSTNSRCMKLCSHDMNCSQVLALAAHGCRHIQLDEPVMMRCRILGPHREYKRKLGPQREPYSAPGTLRTPWSLV